MLVIYVIRSNKKENTSTQAKSVFFKFVCVLFIMPRVKNMDIKQISNIRIIITFGCVKYKYSNDGDQSSFFRVEG